MMTGCSTVASARRRSRRCTCRSRSDSARAFSPTTRRPCPWWPSSAAWPSARARPPARSRELLGALPGQPHVELVATDGFLHPNAVLDARVASRCARASPRATTSRRWRGSSALRASARRSCACRCTRTSGTTSFPESTGRGPTASAAHGRPRAHRARRSRHSSTSSSTSTPTSATSATGSLPASCRCSPKTCSTSRTQAWDEINVVNLHEHILPARERADAVLEKRADHVVSRVVLRDAGHDTMGSDEGDGVMKASAHER